MVTQLEKAFPGDEIDPLHNEGYFGGSGRGGRYGGDTDNNGDGNGMFQISIKYRRVDEAHTKGSSWF